MGREDEWNDLLHEKEQLRKELNRYVVKIEEYSRKIMGLEEAQGTSQHVIAKYQEELAVKAAEGELNQQLSV